MNVEKIPLSILGAVRQRLGADSEDDESKDKLVENLSPKELVAKYAGWHLGDEEWGRVLIAIYVQLKELEVEE